MNIWRNNSVIKVLVRENIDGKYLHKGEALQKREKTHNIAGARVIQPLPETKQTMTWHRIYLMKNNTNKYFLHYKGGKTAIRVLSGLPKFWISPD